MGPVTGRIAGHSTNARIKQPFGFDLGKKSRSVIVSSLKTGEKSYLYRHDIS